MEKILKEKFGDNEILFVAKDLPAHLKEQINVSVSTGLNAEDTSSLKHKITDLRHLIKDMVTAFGNDMQVINSSTGAKKVELDLGFSLTIGGWIVGLETKNEVNLKITWEK